MKQIFGKKTESPSDEIQKGKQKISIEETFLQSLKTIRKLERSDEKLPVRFEWPTILQMLTMPKD